MAGTSERRMRMLPPSYGKQTEAYAEANSGADGVRQPPWKTPEQNDGSGQKQNTDELIHLPVPPFFSFFWPRSASTLCATALKMCRKRKKAHPIRMPIALPKDSPREYLFSAGLLSGISHSFPGLCLTKLSMFSPHFLYIIFRGYVQY